MQFFCDNEEVTIDVMLKYHDLTEEELKDLVGDKNKLELDGLEYKIKRNLRTTGRTERVKKNRSYKNVDIIEMYRNKIPRGLRRHFECDGVRHSAVQLSILYNLEYNRLIDVISGAKSFTINGNLYNTVVDGYIFNLIHFEKESLYGLVMGEVKKITGLTHHTVKTYAQEGFYSKNGYKLEFGEMI